MSTQLILKRWCDGVRMLAANEFEPRHGDERVRAQERGPYSLGGKPKMCDTCDKCDDDMTVAEMRYVLAEFGSAVGAGKKPKQQQPAPQKQADGRTDCLWCDTNTTWGAWGGHLREVHGFSGIKEALGNQCPACGEKLAGLSVHITRGHDEFAMVTDAFFWARDNGDPYGVWAKVTAPGRGTKKAETLL